MNDVHVSSVTNCRLQSYQFRVDMQRVDTMEWNSPVTSGSTMLNSKHNFNREQTFYSEQCVCVCTCFIIFIISGDVPVPRARDTVSMCVSVCDSGGGGGGVGGETLHITWTLDFKRPLNQKSSIVLNTILNILLIEFSTHGVRVVFACM